MKSVITCAIALTAVIAFASPAKAQGCDALNGGEIVVDLCGFVWNDTNGDGIQNDDTDLVMDGDQRLRIQTKPTRTFHHHPAWAHPATGKTIPRCGWESRWAACTTRPTRRPR